jgi:hypothetical protein
MAFHGLPQKACKEAPKPKCDNNDDDDDDCNKVKWQHKHPAKKKPSHCG